MACRRGQQQFPHSAWRRAAGHRARRGTVSVRRRWQPADRLLLRHGADDAGPHPGVGAQAVKEQVATRHPVRRPDREIEFEAARILCEAFHPPSASASARRARKRRRPPFGWRAPRPAQRSHPEVRRPLSRLVRQYPAGPPRRRWNAAGPRRRAGAGAGQRGPGCRSGALDVCGWNDLARLEARLAKGEVAARHHGAGDVQAGRDRACARLSGRRARRPARKHGAILIFDEVITGFRLGRGGAQQRFGVTPDLAIFAKAIANGFPVAAIAGRADLLDMFAPAACVHGGTFNAQPVDHGGDGGDTAGADAEHYECR